MVLNRNGVPSFFVNCFVGEIFRIRDSTVTSFAPTKRSFNAISVFCDCSNDIPKSDATRNNAP